MTIVFEVSMPFQCRPGRHKSDSMYRFWWLWFAVALLRVPFKEFCEQKYPWAMRPQWRKK